MSIIYSLLLALLWFSYHACHARSFGISNDESHHSISKENEELNPSRVSTSIPKSDIAKDDRFEKEKVVDDDNKEPKTRIEDDHVVSVSVSWRVPQKIKGGEPEAAGFNLDYLPPKTHPPVHN